MARFEQKIKRLSTLVDVNALISSLAQSRPDARERHDHLQQVMNADASSLMRIDEKTNELVYEVAKSI